MPSASVSASTTRLEDRRAIPSAERGRPTQAATTGGVEDEEAPKRRSSSDSSGPSGLGGRGNPQAASTAWASSAMVVAGQADLAGAADALAVRRIGATPEVDVETLAHLFDQLDEIEAVESQVFDQASVARQLRGIEPKPPGRPVQCRGDDLFRHGVCCRIGHILGGAFSESFDAMLCSHSNGCPSPLRRHRRRFIVMARDADWQIAPNRQNHKTPLSCHETSSR